jgi:large subunit ribosomal protein L20
MRIKRGVTKRASKKKVLDLAKGYRMSYSKLYKRAKEAVLHAGQYSYAHRKHRPAQMRKEWIRAISAGLVNTNLSYSRFIDGLKKKNIMIDRKNLAELVTYNPEHFKQIVEVVSK